MAVEKRGGRKVLETNSMEEESRMVMRLGIGIIMCKKKILAIFVGAFNFGEIHSFIFFQLCFSSLFL